MGPAGYTLAHHLMNDGHTVVGIDGLKIEPLSPEISGVSKSGEQVPFGAIQDAGELDENLDERMPGGFGGLPNTVLPSAGIKIFSSYPPATGTQGRVWAVWRRPLWRNAYRR